MKYLRLLYGVRSVLAKLLKTRSFLQKMVLLPTGIRLYYVKQYKPAERFLLHEESAVKSLFSCKCSVSKPIIFMLL